MNILRFAICLAVCGFSSAAQRADASAECGWQPARTWLFVVGALEWKHQEMFGSFPQKERRDEQMVELFKGAGVPPAQIVYLQDKEATQERIDAAFAAELAKVKSGDLLLLYYAGHGSKSEAGDDTYLASYDAGDQGVDGWSVNAIPDTIEKYPGVTRVLWLIDCCYSGQAAEVIRKGKYRSAYACVTSSSASE